MSALVQDHIGHLRGTAPSQLRPRLGPRPHPVRSVPQSGSGAASTAVLQERARIARDLHDSVSQTLFAIALTASRGLHRSDQTDGSQMQLLTILHEVLGLADSGQSELRSLIANLRSDLLISGGLTGALTSLATSAQSENQVDIRLSLTDEPDVAAATKEALVLISREALHNVARHARADHIDIVLEVGADSLLLLIADNGIGFDATTPRFGHFGLQSMRERASAVGGLLTLVSAERMGTQIRVRVPRTSGSDG